MTKRPNLAANVKAAAGAPRPEPLPQLIPPPVASDEAAKRPPSRTGRKAVYAWVEPAEHRRLKQLSLDSGRSIDALVTEAVHLLFAKYAG